MAVLRRVPVVNDYESLAAGRYGEFFDRLAGVTHREQPFDGPFEVGPNTDWKLLDLTGTRFLVIAPGGRADMFRTNRRHRHPTCGSC